MNCMDTEDIEHCSANIRYEKSILTDTQEININNCVKGYMDGDSDF